MPAAEFFRGVFTTASDHDGVVVEVVFPRPAPRAALMEFAERRGDIETTAAAVDLGASQVVPGGVVPVRLPGAEKAFDACAMSRRAEVQAGSDM